MMILAPMFAAAVWAWVFLAPVERFWWRSLGAALALGAVATVIQARAGRLDVLLAPVAPVDLLLGTVLALVAIAAVRIGYPIARRRLPPLADRADDLFALRGHASPWLIGLAASSMGVAEELFFRGLVQERWGLLVALTLYTLVQLAGRNWLLLVLGLVGGAVWGLLYAATGGLVAPILSHALPVAVTAVWPPAGVRERYPAGQ